MLLVSTTKDTNSMEFLDWWTTDRVVAVVGLGVTLAGTTVAIWQLLRTRRAAESARAASQATRTSLRSADLRRALDTSVEIGRRLDQTNRREQLSLYLGDWLVSYQRIYALLVRSDGPAFARLDELVGQIEKARGEVMVARDAVATQASWAAYSRGFLRRALLDFGAAAESLLIAHEDEEVGRHAA
jgi:hypothetical protein